MEYLLKLIIDLSFKNELKIIQFQTKNIKEIF